MTENCGQKAYGVALDIGTTTLAMQLVDMATGEILDIDTALNSQRLYGADVLRRINAANRGKAEQLQSMLKEDVQRGVQAMLRRNDLQAGQLKKIVIACNTTMTHLLLRLSCEALGVYPFTPVTLDRTEPEAAVPTSILPGISAYVGGDIVAGLMACGFDRMTDCSLFVDLGTNGEMALGNRHEILCTSTAAGPAFEGGSISCGTGGIEGAVCKVKIQGTQCRLQTIGNQPPVGICGAGLLDAVSELLKAELIDDTGCYVDAYFEKGYSLGRTSTGKPLSLSQQDIRELQMAKAAVRTGIELLAARYGVHLRDIGQVYLAGGLGQHMNIENAVRIGLFPAELQDRIISVGNTSLQGAYIDLMNADAVQREEALISVAKDFPLAMEKDFNELYIKYMSFEQTPGIENEYNHVII